MKQFFPTFTESTPDRPYAVQLTQHGWGFTLDSFASEAEAVEFAELQWRLTHDDKELMEGGEDRAKFSVWHNTHDEEGYIVDAALLWKKYADEVL